MSSVPAWRQSPYLEPRQPWFQPDLTGPLELVTASAGQLVALAEAKAQCSIDLDQPGDDALVLRLVRAATEYCERDIPGNRQLLAATYTMPVLYWWTGALPLPQPPLVPGSVAIAYYDSAGNLQTLDPTLYLVRTPWRQPGNIERAPNKSWPALQGDRRWPVLVTFTAGYGPATTVAAAIAAGTRTVTPGTTFGMTVGAQLVIDAGPAQETVTLTAVTGSTFTAVFAQAHPLPATGGIPVSAAVPETIVQAVLMLAAYWYRQRESAASGKVPTEVAQGVERLLNLNGWGAYK